MEEYNGLMTTDFSDEMNRLSEAFAKMGEEFAMATKAIVDAFSKALVSLHSTMESLTSLIESIKEDDADRTKALELGLVSHKVVQLSYRRDRTGNKNMNRIRKELKIYGKCKGSHDHCTGVGQPEYSVREMPEEGS